MNNFLLVQKFLFSELFLEEEVLYLLASFLADLGLANRFHVAFSVADPDIELRVGGGGGGGVGEEDGLDLLALLAFFPSVNSFSLPKIREGEGHSRRSAELLNSGTEDNSRDDSLSLMSL